MSELVGSLVIAAIAAPNNGDDQDADVVRNNDSSLRTGILAHDADAGLHLQSGTLAARPAAGSQGRKWFTTDGARIYYDTGSAWLEAAYLPLVGGTVTGATVFSGAVTFSAVPTFAGGIATTTLDASGAAEFDGGVTITAGGLIVSAGATSVQGLTCTTLNTGTLAASGAATLAATTVTTLTASGLTTLNGRAQLGSQGVLKRYSGGDAGATPTIDWANGNWQVFKLTANCTPAFSNPQVGADYRLELFQDAVGGRSLTLSGATFLWATGSAPSFTTTANKKDVIQLSCIDATGGGTYIASVVAVNLANTTP